MESQESSDTQEFGYDAAYFQSHLSSELSEQSEKEFEDLNQEIDSQLLEDDQGDVDGLYDESEFDESDFEDDVEVDGDLEAKVEISSPYHLDPGYRGKTNPKELEKPREADSSDSIDQPNPSLDQNIPLEQQHPATEESQNQFEEPEEIFQEPESNNDQDLSENHKYSNNSKPGAMDGKDSTLQPSGAHDSEEEQEVTKGKQVLDKEETDSLVIGNQASGNPRIVKGNALKSGFIQDDSLVEGFSVNKTRSKFSRRPFTTTISSMDDDTSNGFKGHINLISVLFMVGILSGFITIA